VRSLRVKLAVAVAVIGAVAITAAAVAGNRPKLGTALRGYEEVPAISTTGHGTFEARISKSSQEIPFTLTYDNLEGDVTQSHIHFGQKSVNGNIVVFLCSNLGNGPAGTQACPPPPATVTGVITPAQVTNLAAAQGIKAGEFDELVNALRAGVAYANVHSTTWPGGEIRGQLGKRRHR
jgi:hypothetical protein